MTCRSKPTTAYSHRPLRARARSSTSSNMPRPKAYGWCAASSKRRRNGAVANTVKTAGHGGPWRYPSRKGSRPFTVILPPIIARVVAVPSSAAASALMALEAWGHRQIESGRAFGDVLHDVLGPSGSSVAFLAVAADLALSHWVTARPFIWPLLATPELLCWDHWRYRHDLTGANRLLRWEQEPAGAQVKRADLDARASRRSQLIDHIGDFTLHGPPETLSSLRQALQVARDRIVQTEPDDDDPIAGLRATAERALRMTDAQHWLLRKGKRPDGTEVEGYEFQLDPAEAARLEANQARVVASTQHFNIRLQLQAALLDPAKSTPEIVREGLQWAKTQPPRPQPSDDGERARRIRHPMGPPRHRHGRRAGRAAITTTRTAATSWPGRAPCCWPQPAITLRSTGATIRSNTAPLPSPALATLRSMKKSGHSTARTPCSIWQRTPMAPFSTRLARALPSSTGWTPRCCAR